MSITVKKLHIENKIPITDTGFPDENELHFQFLANKDKVTDEALQEINLCREKELNIIHNTHEVDSVTNESTNRNDYKLETTPSNVQIPHTNKDSMPKLNMSNHENEFRVLQNKQYNRKHDLYFDNSDEEDSKRELLFKFEILRKSYPNTDIPTFSIHNDLATMNKQYQYIIRKVQLESNVDNYKSYLIGSFMFLEFVFGKVGFDMSGFSQQQMLQMNKYEKLLIELGEKSYLPKKSFPVEVRLLGLIVFNAVVFAFSKVIMDKTGANILNAMSNMNTSNKTKKMSGPDPI